MLAELEKIHALIQSGGKAEYIIERYAALVPGCIDALFRISDLPECSECEKRSKCPHFDGSEDWNRWWKKNRKTFEVVDPPEPE